MWFCLKQEQLNEMIDMLDVDGNGHINYRLASCLLHLISSPSGFLFMHCSLNSCGIVSSAVDVKRSFWRNVGR